MQTFFSEEHRLHFPQGELHGGELVTPFERPSRIEHVLRRLRERGFPTPVQPPACDEDVLARVHDAGYLAFLGSAWGEWTRAGFRGEIIATGFPARRMPSMRPPVDIDGKVGYYALAAETAITGGTWRAALSSCASAQAAQRHVSASSGAAPAAFALCRPPGHHAALDMYGGYCFLNNAAAIADDVPGRRSRTGRPFSTSTSTTATARRTSSTTVDDVLFASLHGRSRTRLSRTSAATPTSVAKESRGRCDGELPAPARHRPRSVERGTRYRARTGPRVRRERARRLARRRRLPRRPDQLLPPRLGRLRRLRPTPCDPRPADRVRHGRRLRDRGGRRQHGQRARGVRGAGRGPAVLDLDLGDVDGVARDRDVRAALAAAGRVASLTRIAVGAPRGAPLRTPVAVGRERRASPATSAPPARANAAPVRMKRRRLARSRTTNASIASGAAGGVLFEYRCLSSRQVSPDGEL